MAVGARARRDGGRGGPGRCGLRRRAGAAGLVAVAGGQRSVVLTVTGPDGTRELTMPELQALPAFEGYAGIKSSTGMITPPAVHKGAPLSEIVELVGGLGRTRV